MNCLWILRIKYFMHFKGFPWEIDKQIKNLDSYRLILLSCSDQFFYDFFIQKIKKEVRCKGLLSLFWAKDLDELWYEENIFNLSLFNFLGEEQNHLVYDFEQSSLEVKKKLQEGFQHHLPVVRLILSSKNSFFQIAKEDKKEILRIEVETVPPWEMRKSLSYLCEQFDLKVEKEAISYILNSRDSKK